MMNNSMKYYTAVIASLLSTLGWLSALTGIVYTLYLVGSGGNVSNAVTWTLVAVGIGIFFALLEKRLYRIGQ